MDCKKSNETDGKIILMQEPPNSSRAVHKSKNEVNTKSKEKKEIPKLGKAKESYA